MTGTLGATAVIAVDVTFPPVEADLNDPFDARYQGFSILTRRAALDERADANVMIAAMLPEHRELTQATLSAMIDAGEAAGHSTLPKVRALFGAGRMG